MDPKQQPREQPAERLVAWSVVCLALFTIAVYIGYRYDITLWDWLKLLVVPVVIAGVGIWFNRQQRERELEIAERRTQDEALQAYLDVMSQLLTDEKRPLRRAQIGDSLSSVARARTLTVLPRLDGGRKGRVVQFLYEAGLIAKGRPILDLLRADLRGADLNGAGLRGADLNGAHLSGADLSFADLSGADLRRVDLLNAVLSGTVLRGADLRRASLRGAQGRTVEQLRAAKSLEEATMPDGKILRGEANPDGPTFDEWVKDRKDRKGDAENA
jgi:Pentapeptide repeats (8 copies)